MLSIVAASRASMTRSPDIASPRAIVEQVGQLKLPRLQPINRGQQHQMREPLAVAQMQGRLAQPRGLDGDKGQIGPLTRGCAPRKPLL